MRPEVMALIERGHLPGEDELDEVIWASWDAAVRAIADAIATDEEARAVLRALPERRRLRLRPRVDVASLHRVCARVASDR